jgi:hypothetical protein
VITSGSSSTHSSTGTVASGTHPSGTSSTASTSTTSPQVQVVSQSNLNPPGGKGSAKGVGVVVKANKAYGIIIEAQRLPPNNHNAYAAWLSNSATDNLRLGFVGQPVGKTGKLEVASPLPANAGHYKQLLLTLETQTKPKSPGTVVLQGPFQGVPATG